MVQSTPPRLRHSSIAAFFALRLLRRSVTIPVTPLPSSIAIAPQLSAHLAGGSLDGAGPARSPDVESGIGDGPHCALPEATPCGQAVCANAVPLIRSNRTETGILRVISNLLRSGFPSQATTAGPRHDLLLASAPCAPLGSTCEASHTLWAHHVLAESSRTAVAPALAAIPRGTCFRQHRSS